MGAIEAVVETGVYVTDLDQAEAFYRDVLGLPVIGKEAGRHVFFRVGQANVLLVYNAATTLRGDILPPMPTTPGGNGWRDMGSKSKRKFPGRAAAGRCTSATRRVIPWSC
jgi:catechol 2,3-dioxygenase-like lactoylglutathione lyase family enzyme